MYNSTLFVNLSAIKNNAKLIRKKLFNGQKLCAVVKSNCYGLGAKKVCEELDSVVDYFAVSCTKEFYQISRCTTKPILILSPVYKNIKRLIERGANLTVCNIESLIAVAKAAMVLNTVCKVHIAVNTGMNRFGFKSEKDFELALKVLKKTQNIQICGVFSHYYQANNQNFAKNQYNKFLDFNISYLNITSVNTIFHIAATDGVSFKNGFDMVRVGMGLYSDKNFETVKLVSKILDIQTLNKNETAGYNAVFVADKPSKIAVVGVGYADGIFRNIVGKGYVLIRGQKAKIVAVCMDSILVNITDVDAKIFDDAVLIGKSENSQIFICDIASWCDTISYEILTSISSRVKRKYIR